MKDKLGPGIFVEGVLVLVKGEAQSSLSGEFAVDGIFMPPPEDAEDTMQTYPGVDFFGGQVPAKLTGQLEEWEQNNSESMIYVFSDLLLDNPKVSIAGPYSPSADPGKT